MTGGGFLNNCTIIKPLQGYDFLRWEDPHRFQVCGHYSKHNAFHFPKSLCRSKFYL